MLEILPSELWLNIFKQMDIEELFKKREVCKYFNKLINNNLIHFYRHYSNIYYCFNNKLNAVTMNDFIECNKKLFYLSEIKKNNCPNFELENIKKKKLSVRELELILKLKLLGISDHYSIKVAMTFTESKLNHLYTLLKIKDLWWVHAIWIVEEEII